MPEDDSIAQSESASTDLLYKPTPSFSSKSPEAVANDAPTVSEETAPNNQVIPPLLEGDPRKVLKRGLLVILITLIIGAVTIGLIYLNSKNKTILPKEPVIEETQTEASPTDKRPSKIEVISPKIGEVGSFVYKYHQQTNTFELINYSKEYQPEFVSPENKLYALENTPEGKGSNRILQIDPITQKVIETNLPEGFVASGLVPALDESGLSIVAYKSGIITNTPSMFLFYGKIPLIGLSQITEIARSNINMQFITKENGNDYFKIIESVECGDKVTYSVKNSSSNRVLLTAGSYCSSNQLDLGYLPDSKSVVLAQKRSPENPTDVVPAYSSLSLFSLTEEASFYLIDLTDIGHANQFYLSPTENVVVACRENKCKQIKISGTIANASEIARPIPTGFQTVLYQTRLSIGWESNNGSLYIAPTAADVSQIIDKMPEITSNLDVMKIKYIGSQNNGPVLTVTAVKSVIISE